MQRACLGTQSEKEEGSVLHLGELAVYKARLLPPSGETLPPSLATQAERQPSDTH